MRRIPEIGLRIALGASTHDIRMMVIREALVTAAAGLVRWGANERSSTVVVSSSEESRLMDITVPKSLEALVRRKVEEGHYSTEDDVVADALRLMQARDEVAQIKRARLQDAIERGYQDVAAGKVIRLESDDQIEAFFADL